MQKQITYVPPEAFNSAPTYRVRRPGHAYWSEHTNAADARRECAWANSHIQRGHRVYAERPNGDVTDIT